MIRVFYGVNSQYNYNIYVYIPAFLLLLLLLRYATHFFFSKTDRTTYFQYDINNFVCGVFLVCFSFYFIFFNVIFVFFVFCLFCVVWSPQKQTKKITKKYDKQVVQAEEVQDMAATLDPAVALTGRMLVHLHQQVRKKRSRVCVRVCSSCVRACVRMCV